MAFSFNRPKCVLQFGKTVTSQKETTRANPYSPTLSQNRFGVATIVNEKHKKVWNVTKSVVTLQCQKSTKRLATDKEINSINNLN